MKQIILTEQEQELLLKELGRARTKYLEASYFHIANDVNELMSRVSTAEELTEA